MTKYWAISSDQSQDGSALEPLYADTLTFYSGNKTRSEVIGLKIAYFRDWNVRKYTSHDIQVNCQERLCTAEGLVDWELVSESRRVMSTGRSTFSFIVDWAAGEGKIVNENGAVLNREAHKI